MKLIKYPFYLIFCAKILINCTIKKQVAENTTVSKKPNVILIITDDQGYGNAEVYPYTNDLYPQGLH